jgi:hypothetical protein
MPRSKIDVVGPWNEGARVGRILSRLGVDASPGRNSGRQSGEVEDGLADRLSTRDWRDWTCWRSFSMFLVSLGQACS